MFDQLTQQVGEFFTQVKDHRGPNATYPLGDCLKAGYAMFSLKSPSLLAFRQSLEYEVRQENLQRIYGLQSIPGDTALREAIDGINPQELYGAFEGALEQLRHEGVWESRKVLGGYLPISIDATGHYCSGKQSCPHCLVKNLRNGQQIFHHQMLGAVQVHPESKSVFPVSGEAIVRQDGHTKNDCEQNAAKRLIPRVAEQLTGDKLLFLLDALYATGPVVKLIKEHQASFLITIKEGYVLLQADRLKKEGKLQQLSWSNAKTKSTVRFTSDLVLNGKHREQLVNYIEYEQVDIRSGKVKYANKWITDIPIHESNIQELVGVARARWKIENETFNTLKNQGYNLEHNYGHGKKYLATNFALLTLLAFLVDQIAQVLDYYFQKAYKKAGSKGRLWEKVRQVFDLFPAMSMNAIYKFLVSKPELKLPFLE